MAARFLLRLCLAGALLLDGYLAWHSLSGAPVAGCGGAEGCDAVLATSWGYFLGIPVSVAALVTHGSLLGLTARRRGMIEPGWQQVTEVVLAGSILLAAVWFGYVQAEILGRFCRLCLTDHALGSAGALIFLATQRTREGWRRDALGWGLAAAGILLLIAGQQRYPSERIAVGPLGAPVRTALAGIDRIVTVSPGTLPASLSELPFLGDAKAPMIIVVLFDFTCPDCRRLHPLLEQALQKYPSRLCVILLPVPIAPGCNRYIANLLPEHADACDYARLALALWRHNPDDFRAFRERFVEANQPAEPIATARAWAEERIGKANLEAALGDPWVNRRLEWDVEVFARLARSSGRVEMPKLILGSQLITGAPSDFAHFDELLRADTNIH